MSTNRNIVEMVEAIRKGTGGSNSADGVDGTYMADVLSVKPLTIRCTIQLSQRTFTSIRH